MRKKLFAVIMSAMMMITFMPAMAFASTALDGDVTVSPAQTGWYVSDFKGPLDEQGDYSFTYDGKEHTISFKVTQNAEKKCGITVNYYNLYTAKNKSFVDVTPVKSTTAPVVKDAGMYAVDAVGYRFDDIYVPTQEVVSGDDLIEVETWWGLVTKVKHKDVVNNHVKVVVPFEATIWVTVSPRKVGVQGFRTLVMTKAYDGKGFTLSDKDFTIVPILGADGKEDPKTGLIAGDTLLTKTITTAPDVGVYYLSDWNHFNTNYELVDKDGFTYKMKLEIVKADNAAKIASQKLTIKRGSSKAVKFSATFGTAKLTKLSGNTKISVKNGKIKVAKSCKKGTYKVKVKASAAGNNNYASASRVKTLTIIVK